MMQGLVVLAGFFLASMPVSEGAHRWVYGPDRAQSSGASGTRAKWVPIGLFCSWLLMVSVAVANGDRLAESRDAMTWFGVATWFVVYALGGCASDYGRER